MKTVLDNFINKLYGNLNDDYSTEAEQKYYSSYRKKTVKFGDYQITIVLDEFGRFHEVIGVEKKESFYNKTKIGSNRFLSASEYLLSLDDDDDE